MLRVKPDASGAGQDMACDLSAVSGAQCAIPSQELEEKYLSEQWRKAGEAAYGLRQAIERRRTLTL